MVTNIYRRDRRNVGDFHCSPLLYFDFPFPTQVIDVKGRRPTDLDKAIIGGGGLIHNRDYFSIEDVVSRTKGKVVSWGMGHNIHGGDQSNWPKYMQRFALHGVRDWGSPFDWVPCAS